MDNNYAGIKVLLELKRKRLMDKLGLTHSDSVGTDTLAKEVKNIQDKKSRVTQIIETVKRERENEDPLDNVYKRLKTDYQSVGFQSVDFSIEKSDDEGPVLNVKFNNTDPNNNESEQIEKIGISDEEESIVTQILEPDSEAKDIETGTVFSFASSSSTSSTISKEDVENFFKNPRIIYKNEIKEKQTYQIPKSAFDSYTSKIDEKTKDDVEKLGEAYKKLKKIESPFKCVKTRVGRPATVFNNPSKITTDVIDKQKKEIKELEENINNNITRLNEAEKTLNENIEEKQEPIGFFNLKKYLSQTFIGNSGFELINYDNDEDMVKLVEKSIVIADTFSGHQKLEDQLQLFQDLSKEDPHFFTISDCEMDEYFKKIIPEPKYGKYGMIKDWKQYLKLFPQARITVPKIQEEQPKNVRAFLHYALNTDKYKNLVKLVNLANRVKVLAFLQEFPIQDEAETLDTESKSGESRVPLEQDYDGYGVEPLVPGKEYTIVIDDNYWEYMMAVSPLPDGGGKKTKEVKKNKSKKPKSVSQKKGGFLKGILKNFGSCGCDKKGKSKTKRRKGRNVSFKKKKSKKLGGKRTFRKERKNKKRVRFTIKA